MNPQKIEQDKLNHIANKTTELVSTINQGVEWVAKHLKDNDRADTNYNIKKYRRTLNKVKAVVTEKPAVALFGASQVGKSYMANNLLYNFDNKLEVYDHQKGESMDFIKYINPEGKGNEATAPVTRFTSHRETDPNRLPIHLKIFSPRDIVCILCDTYYSDFNDRKQLPDKQVILDYLQGLEQHTSATVQHILTDDDIYEIKEYLEKYFFKNGFIQNLRATSFWDKLSDSIKYIPTHKWVNVLDILWNQHQEISNIFVTIIEYLNKLKFARKVNVDFEAVVRAGGRSIISVQTLLEGFFNDTHSFKVQLEDGSLQEASAAKLCLVTTEVVLSVADGTIQNRPFIKDIDIIDFPGARSRPEINDLSDKNILEMMLRGKVSYLFNYYSSNYKSNTLGVCMRTSQTNVTTVPRLVNQWIEDNLGVTPEERALNLNDRHIPSLFIIFTWWNTQFLFKKSTDDPEPTERIQKLFDTRFKEEIKGSYDWNEKWMRSNGSLKRFTNFYLLRDFKESTEIFTNIQDSKGNDVEQVTHLYQENRLNLYEPQWKNFFFTNPEQGDFHQKYFDKFIEYHTNNNRFFENPEEAFLESSIPGKDGSEYIIKNLVPVASNTVSVPIYINVLNKALENAKQELDKHYHSDQADEQIKKAATEGSGLQLKMDIVFGEDTFYFGKFIESLTISEGEVFQIYHEVLQSELLVRKKNINTYILLRANNPALSFDKKYEENLEVLRKNYNKNSKEETEQHFTQTEDIDLNELFYGDLHNLQNNSLILAEKAQDHWFNTKLSLDNFQFFVEKGFDPNMLNTLFDNLKVSFQKLKLTKIIANDIRGFTDALKKINEAEEMIAHITAGRINEFINSVGWSYYAPQEKEKIKDTNEANKLGLKIPIEQEVFHSLEKTAQPENGKMSLDKLLDYMEQATESLSKTSISPDVIQYIPMIKSYQNWVMLLRISFIANCDIPTYDIEANQQLGVILEHLKQYSFAIQ